MQISEFAAWLRTRTNRNKHLFQEATVEAIHAGAGDSPGLGVR